ncbi:MAG: DinB family protein [Planctomycetales bacterium]|nr:DinB family protein [Planctomycetales bacterium]
MNAIDYIRLEMSMCKGWIGGLMDDIQDSPLTLPTPNGGNHPLWIVGHLAYSEANILNVYILGKDNPLAEWKDILGIGSQPANDPSVYPHFSELRATLEQVRSDTLAYLDTITDADLDKPSHAPEDRKDYFGTIGQCLAVMSIHMGFHGGQIADARRAAGRNILMA